MQDFVFRMLTKVKFGVGLVSHTGQECKDLGAAKAFLITGRTATRKAAFFKTVTQSLEEQGIDYEVYSEIEADPSVETIDKAVEVLKNSRADIVIALGGGSPIDAAKAVTILQTNEGSVRDYIQAKRQVKNPSIPLICISTTAGTGSEVTAAAVITDTQNECKAAFSHDYMMPTLAIIDPQTHIGMPVGITAATGLDALTHAIESYVSLNAEPISDAYALQAIKMIGKYLRVAVANPNNMDARSNMALASLLAGAAFANAGVGVVHGIAHSLGAKYHLSHGMANGIVLPYAMERNSVGNLEKFKEIAEALGENVEGMSLREAANCSVEAVKMLKKDVGIPDTLQQAGLNISDFSGVIEDTMNFRLLSINPCKLNEKDVEKILKNAYGN